LTAKHILIVLALTSLAATTVALERGVALGSAGPLETLRVILTGQPSSLQQTVASASARSAAPKPRPNPLPTLERDAAANAVRKATAALAATDGASIETMIGQMLMVGFDGTDVDEAGPRRILHHIRAGRLGGVILFKRNVESEAAVKRLTAAFRAAAPGLPVLVAVDQEGGRVRRLTPSVGFPYTPSAERLADRGTGVARQAYARLARHLAAFGFNVNLAPVVDLSVRRDNPIIGRLGRAFSADPDVVTRLAGILIEAHHRAGILTALKHFPGHGSSGADTHEGFVDVTRSWSPRELLPYRRLIASGRADMVMVAHVHHGTFSPPETRAPASLSAGVIEGLLRGELGYDGVVISDDMEMGAIRKLGSPVDIAVRAILAGNDILVYAGGATPGRDLVAVLQQRLKRAALADPRVAARIRESYARIARLKQRLD
jgi:beta-N-acetylhexosaminidase